MKSISLNLPDEILDAAGLRAWRMRLAAEKCREEDMKIMLSSRQLGQMSKTKGGGCGG